VLVLGVAVAAALFAAGCGGSKKSSSSTGASSTPAAATTSASSGAAAGGGGSTVSLSADPTALKFDKTSLTATAGTVTLKMANPSGVAHAIAVEGNGVDKSGSTVQKGGTSTVTVSLKAGKYTFYCPVDGHRAAGMQGSLTVQ
jgi:plastocyanin